MGSALTSGPSRQEFDALSTSVGSGSLDVTKSPYNALPGLPADPLPGIQAAIDQAATNAAAGSGPTEVVVPAGIYQGALRTIPNQTRVAALLWGRSNVTLRLMPGAIIKLKDHATLPGSATEGHGISVIVPYGSTLAHVKDRWTICGQGVLDLNGNNQDAIPAATPFQGALFTGVHLDTCKSATVQGLRVQNLYGLGNGPPTESYHFNVLYSRDTTFIGCEVDGSGATDTSTGFNHGFSFSTRFVGCVAHDLAHGMGFAAFEEAGASYAGCVAYKCGFAGFSAERSNDLSYGACISGGKSPLMENGNQESPFFPAGQVSLGGQYGWVISGCTRVSLDAACHGSYHTTNGVYVRSNAASGGYTVRACDTVSVRGTFMGNGNGSRPVQAFIEQASDGAGKLDQQSVYVDAKIDVNPDFGTTRQAVGPIESYLAKNGSSGVRFYAEGVAQWAFRWLRYGGTIPDLFVDGQGVVGTLGRARNRTAVSANYTIVPTDHVLGVTAACTLKLPDLTELLPGSAVLKIQTGAHYVIQDEAGAAGPDTPIIITDFAAAEVARIVTPYQTREIYNKGGGWVVEGQGADGPEETIPLLHLTSNALPLTTQSMRLAYFQAKASEAITKVVIPTGAVAAAATPTLVRAGIFSVAANGDLALVASTPNDTTLMAAINTEYQKALSATWNKVKGKWYAYGLLVVSAATMPQTVGYTAPVAAMAGGGSGRRRRIGLVSGQTDLPASVAAASIVDSTVMPYAVMLS